MRLNACGRLVDRVWQRIVDEAQRAHLDVLQVMPNHIHAIIVISDVEGASDPCRDEGESPGPAAMGSVLGERPTGPAAGGLGAVVGNLKSVCARRINAMRGTPSAKIWQRNYWEHIIRDDDDYARIDHYVVTNPAHWADDRLYEPDSEGDSLD
ncbi:MAG: transposase [Anaerolineae bacterium]